MTRAAAIFLFNHRFERNVEKLEAIYADRFSDRQYIMPFSQSQREGVVSIYETSWNFSGHIAQAWPRIERPDATHYVFIADDLILNPALNEDNILEQLNVAPGGGYIKSLASTDTNRYCWYRALPICKAFDEQEPGFDYKSELPSAAEAEERFRKMGIPLRFPFPLPLAELKPSIRRAGFWNLLRWAGRKTSYPLLYGYSDFLIVPQHAMPKFAHYCGVFAALNVFAEVAVPTALALAVDQIQTELRLGEDFFRPHPRKRRPSARYEGVELWGERPIRSFAHSTGGNLTKMFAEFPPDRLYVHPVKLSQFDW